MQTHHFIYAENPLLTWLYEAERAHTSDERLSRVFWYLSRDKARLVPSESARAEDLPPPYKVKFTKRVY